jgi:hypothetical protein
MEQSGKVVVFDMDETLGYFTEFGIFWDSLKLYCAKENINFEQVESQFNEIFGLYPEFVRPNILTILNYLKRKVESKKCQGVMIYTNNTGPKPWVIHIKDFFESKINYKLFNHVICAFKINGKQVEMCRTTHEKTLTDLIKCTKLPENTQICFLDDLFHPKMSYDNVYYIKLQAYTNELPFSEVLQRFVNSKVGKSIIKNNNNFYEIMTNQMSKYEYDFVEKTKEDYEIDKIVTKKTMIYLQNFFHNKTTADTTKKMNMYFSKKSKKNKKSQNRRTLKNYN